MGKSGMSPSLVLCFVVFLLVVEQMSNEIRSDAQFIILFSSSF